MTPAILSRSAVVLFAFILCVCSGTARAQTAAQERADALRLQLEELKTKQLDLQSRLQTLDEQLKPENIEKSLAGVGSTKPEDLRELKRTQLETEKQNVQKQLDVLTQGQTRLETALAQADAHAYQQSAKVPVIPATPAPTDHVNPTPKNTDEVTKQKRSRLANRKARQRRVTQQD